MIDTIRIFIGYDPNEAVAYHTMANSVIRHSSQPLALHPLALKNFENFYTDSNHLDGSNQFIYSRFLVPYLSNYKGWSIFVDGDMIVRDDIAKLWELRDETKAVQVVKHEYETKMSEKYLGAKNVNYPRKNWSSVILFNNAKCKVLTPEFVQNATGAELHRFNWTEDESLIGELPKEWNHLDGEYDYDPDAKLVHYTLGTPCFGEFANFGSFSSEWHRERMYTDFSAQNMSEFWKEKKL